MQPRSIQPADGSASHSAAPPSSPSRLPLSHSTPVVFVFVRRSTWDDA